MKSLQDKSKYRFYDDEQSPLFEKEPQIQAIEDAAQKRKWFGDYVSNQRLSVKCLFVNFL